MFDDQLAKPLRRGAINEDRLCVFGCQKTELVFFLLKYNDIVNINLGCAWIWSTGNYAPGSGFPPRNALKRASDRLGCDNGASCDAPLMVAKDKMSPYTCVHPAACEK